MNQIIVIGSINMDIVTRVERHPLPGETVKGRKTAFNPGGKGANQAVAAARAGARVRMAGAIGDDPFGEQLKASLEKEGINTEHIIHKAGKSGLAFITVDQKGENSIILEEGANGQVTKEDIIEVFAGADASEASILLQNEIPWETTLSAIDQANEHYIPVYFNPAPAMEIPEAVLSKLNGLFVNETEAERITGVRVTDEQSAKQASRFLIEAGVGEVIITLGDKGSYFADQAGTFIYTPAQQVTALDTTAAGDTFIGAYMVERGSGNDAESSLRFATAAAKLTVMKEGAQQSIPYRQEIKQQLIP